MNWRSRFSDLELGIAERLFCHRNRHYLALDVVIFALAPVLAFWARAESWEAVLVSGRPLLVYVAIAETVRLLTFFRLGLYSRYWRYAGVRDLGEVVLAVLLSTALIALGFFGLLRPRGGGPGELPVLLPFLNGMLVLLMVGGARSSARLADELTRRPADRPAPGCAPAKSWRRNCSARTNPTARRASPRFWPWAEQTPAQSPESWTLKCRRLSPRRAGEIWPRSPTCSNKSCPNLNHSPAMGQGDTPIDPRLRGSLKDDCMRSVLAPVLPGALAEPLRPVARRIEPTPTRL